MNLRRYTTGAGVLAALMASAILPGAASAEAQPPLDGHSVAVAVLGMTPTTPAYTAKPRRLTIQLSLTNKTDQQLYDLSLDVQRDAPYTQQALLKHLVKRPAPGPDPGALSPLPGVEIGPLTPHQTIRYTYRTTTSLQSDDHGICLCFEAGGGVYPINVTAFAASDPDGATTQVGFGQTYLPAFKDAPKRVQVSWVWPLIDRPHRLLDSEPFLDDDLAASVSPDGRLYRALSVVEGVVPRVHLTLLIDPELIAELVAMSQPYVVVADGKRVPGTGTAAAKAWLERLRAVIAMAPSTEVSLTPYADPDVDAVTAAGLRWADNFGPKQQALVQQALGTPPDSAIAWPAGSAITPDALRQVLGPRNTSVVVLDDAALPGTNHDNPAPDALAPLPAQYGVPGAVAAITDRNLQALSDRTLAGTGSAALPALASELAVRAAQEPDHRHYVVLTAPRYVDTDPDVAVRAMLDTARTPWSTSLTLSEAAQTVKPVDHGHLVAPADEHQVPNRAIEAAGAATDFMRDFGNALDASAANTLLGGVPAAIQRAESSAWRADRRRGTQFAAALTRQIDSWRSGVYIVRPSSGTYTLASSDAPLPITVVNTLPVNVHVRISITTVNGVAGLRADDSRVRTIPAAASAKSPTRSTLKIQTHVQRAGSFRVNATLLAPDGAQLSKRPVHLSIHSTALGAVGVIITAVAGGVLVLALGVRVVRRIRARNHRPGADTAAFAEPAGARP